ncbi:hypothetical protein FT663_01830 [Candidozyma haemuli var. vulneris]|nr:hypothetical protein FT663_01830 [[Candida] haemuloni var. vulneris]KAF3993859.1 hypothetical protein FT662_00307 [[Candida] haemuloni var. vulneris]
MPSLEKQGGEYPTRSFISRRGIVIIHAFALLFISGWVLLSYPTRQAETFQSYPHLLDDPVGDEIGHPSLEPSAEFRKTGSSAMVASDVEICSQMGRDILQRNGNAADAAITVALCIGSVNSHSSGIGGGGFIVSWQGDETISIDAREAAPAKAHKNMYEHFPLLAQFGGLAVAVPGEVAGLYELYKAHSSGNFTWAQLIEPVVELNRKGWAAEEIWISSLHRIHRELLQRVPLLKDKWDFIFKESGEIVDVGDWITRPALGDTLDIIAKNGSSDVFYDPHGPIAPKLASRAAKCGGVVTVEDFAAYRPETSKALKYKFDVDDDSYELATSGGVSSGLALIGGLNFYSELEKTAGGSEDPLSAHRLIEAMKWTASVRSNLGDHNATFFQDLVKCFSSREWVQKLLKNGKYSDDTTFLWQHYEPKFELTEPRGTSHFSVVDAQGGAVSMTTTVNLIFGSSVYDNDTGIILNDEMDDFSMPNTRNAFNLTPSVYNFIEPSKRPLSSTTPTIIKKNGELFMLIGAAGGSRIVTAVLQAIVRTVYEKLPLLQTISYPRLHHQLIPEFVMVEDVEMYNTAVPGIENSLNQKNHTLFQSGALTAMNAIKKTGDIWEGVSDHWRKRGVAAGF